MDAEPIFDALPAINHVSTLVAIGCVFPTYFLHLRPATYRLILSVGILFGLSTLAVGIAAVLVGPLDRSIQLFVVSMLLSFSPLVLVLTVILARIKQVTRVALWNTV